MDETVDLLVRWTTMRDRTRCVAVADMHVVAEAQRDRDYWKVLETADLCVADGTPLMLMGRISGFRMERRVYGPDLMLSVLKRTARCGIRHFFYGGAAGVPEELARRMMARFPGLELAGTHSPPFAPFSPVEDPVVLEKINRCRPDVLWVGLGAPKQERWMATRKLNVKAPLLIGVGAAFDFHAGRVQQAPSWMREHGLEWLFRLKSEPRRLWKRYLLSGSEVAFKLLIEISTGRFREREMPLRRAAGS